jgi:SAM-dependent methyltransferase
VTLPASCPVCHRTELEQVLELTDVPTQDGVLWQTAAEARASPLGDIRLVLCHTCSYLWNAAYEPDKVSFQRYDVSLQHSPLYQGFVQELAERLTAAHGLGGRRVLEIGCGRGFFLETLCAIAGCDGIGFDPSYVAPASPSETHRRLTFVPAVYDQGDVTRADLVVCRHVIDIVPDQRGLLDLVRRTLALDAGHAVAYLEIPDARYTFGQEIVWNVVYEHRSWFVPDSFAQLLGRCGLAVTSATPCWHGEYLGVEAAVLAANRVVEPVAPSDNGLAEMAHSLARRLEAERSRWRERAEALAGGARTASIWGAGARAIGLLALVPELAAAIPYVVDVNPARQGLHLPRTGLAVEPPERLLEDDVELVIVSNPTYADEITQQARDLGVRAELLVL